MEKQNKFIWPFVLSLVLAAGLWGGHLLTPNSRGLSWNEDRAKYSKLQDIIEILNERYVDTVNGDKVFEQAISDMLHKLDPHSNYIPVSEVKRANEQIQGKFGGIGVRFSVIRDTICITNVIPHSPASKFGVLAGDKIVEIEGKEVAGKNISNERVMELLKGLENTEVNIQVLRHQEKKAIRIVRGVIPIETIVCATMLTPKIGYIKLNQFSVQSALEFNRAALRLKQQGMKQLIFDLRNNGGGVLQSATDIVDEFLGDRVPIVTTKGLHSKESTYRASSKGILKNMQVVVLINSNSASASEIVAGALQDNDRATIMGRRSFGKGLVQEDILLKDGSNLRLTIARYYTPSGRCIQKPYSKNYQSYYEDQIDRIENGELYHPDSTLLVDSLKFKTKKGKIVYGGGGIMPDIFIPYDTTGSSWYLTDLRYTPVFQNFAFDFLEYKRSHWEDIRTFNERFKVSDQMLNDFVRYAEKEVKIPLNKKGFATSKELIRLTIKAEIARQLWTEQGYYSVAADFDPELQRALDYLTK
ncbi:MAG: S41 family peptidase [Bacteroidetes bacterium]|nr:MAG: S41 family peptidase [Bacteroidota bacterium]